MSKIRGIITVRHRASGRRYDISSITAVKMKDFPYADPWRPITIGYSGLEINLKG